MDFSSRIKINQLVWARRILNNPLSLSARMIGRMMGVDNLEVIFGTKRPSKADPPYPISPFYAEVLRTWTSVHDFIPSDELEVRGKVVWDNKHISSPKAMLRAESWKTWVTAGIITIHHLCHPSESRLLGHQEISDTFGIKCNFLEALRVRNSVPYEWRALLSNNIQEDIEVKYTLEINQKRFDLLTGNPRLWYLEEIRSRSHAFNREDSWKRELGMGEQDQNLDWRAIFSNAYKTTRETKIQSFAYKIVYRIVPCNEFLYKIKIKDSPSCTFCECNDTISHFFHECKSVSALWNSLNSWCENYLDLTLSTLSSAEVILGLRTPVRQQKLINWLLLYTKFYILKKKLFFGAEVSLLELLAELRLKLLTEKRACVWENRTRKFRSWERMLQALG